MLAQLGHEFRTLESVPASGPVVHVGRGHQLATLLEAGDEKGLEIGPGGVNGGAVTGRAGSQDDQSGMGGWRHPGSLGQGRRLRPNDVLLIIQGVICLTGRQLTRFVHPFCCGVFSGIRVARALGLESRGLAAPLTHAVREAALWVLGAVSLIMLVALLTYSPQDPGFSHTGDGTPLHNLIGAIGAWYADVAFSLFGGPALLFPAMTLLVGWIFFTARSSPAPIDRQILITRLSGFALTLATSCALATLHFGSHGLPQTAGGAFGELLGNGLASGLGLLGATLLLLASWLAGVSLFTGLSWLAVMDRVGHHVLDGADRVRALVTDFQSRTAGRRVQEERQEVVRKERKKIEKKLPPRIEPALVAPQPSQRSEKERQVPLFQGTVLPGELPPLSLLG